MATATLDFNNLFPASYVQTQVYNGIVEEDGYRLIGHIGVPEFTQFYSVGSTYAADDVYAYDGPGVIYNPDTVYGTNRVTRVDGQPFDMLSIKLDYVFSSPYLDGVVRPAVVTFTGQKANGTTAAATYTTDLAPGLQTFTFGADFAGVTSVSWNTKNDFTYVLPNTDPTGPTGPGSETDGSGGEVDGIEPSPGGGTTYVGTQQNQFDDIVVNTPDAPPPPPPPPGATTTTVGAGPDTLVLRVSQDAYQGSAQYTVVVDGVQIGGTLTATALRGSGQSDTVNVLGDLAPGSHTVTVNFLNDLYGGTAATDRNLYLEGATYNGGAVSDSARTLYDNGAASIGFTEAGAPPPPPPGGSTTVGAGSDTLVLRVSQDAYQGSAQYTVSVDGVQIGGPLTASALRGSGQSDTVNVLGDWAAGGHSVSITFLNDLYGGTPAADRNLYLDGATYNGAALSGAARTLYDNGVASVGFTDASPIA